MTISDSSHRPTSNYLTLLLCIAALIHISGAHNNTQLCCPVGVELGQSACADHSPAELRNCTDKYIMEPDNADFEFDEDGNMLYTSGYVLQKDSFCISTRNKTPIAVVCMDDEDAPDMLMTMRAACELLSVVFLILTIAVYNIVPILQDLQGKCIVHFLYNMGLSFLFLSVIQQAALEERSICEFFAFAIYYFFLNTFFWLNVISINIWKTTVHPNSLGTEKQWYGIYCTYAYCIPTCFLISTIAAHYSPGTHVKPGFGESSCWFHGTEETWAYFYGPISVLLIANIILFVWSSITLWTSSNDIHATKLRSKRYKFLMCIKLFFIMGVLWIFEILSFASGNSLKVTFWTITDFVNALQGVLIFLLLVAFRKRALRGLAHSRFMCFQMPTSWKTLIDEEDEEDEAEHGITNSKDAEIQR